MRNLRVGTRFVEGLPPQERRALGVSLEHARRFELRRSSAVHFLAGRVALQGGRPARAAIHFRQALRTGSGPARVRALLGLGSVYLGLDLEFMAALYGRIQTRRDRRRLVAAMRPSPVRE